MSFWSKRKLKAPPTKPEQTSVQTSFWESFFRHVDCGFTSRTCRGYGSVCPKCGEFAVFDEIAGREIFTIGQSSGRVLDSRIEFKGTRSKPNHSEGEKDA